MGLSLSRFGGGMLAFAVACAALAFALPSSHATVLQSALIMASLGVSFQIVFGLIGQLSLGQSALFGVGAYAYALSSLHGIPLLAGVVLACLCGGMVGLLAALVTARLGGAYFAVVTFALAGILAAVVIGTPALGGSEGFVGVRSLDSGQMLARRTGQTLIAALCFLVVLTVFFALRRSRLGWTLEAVRSNPLLATSLGINVPLSIILATGISGVLAALSGAVFAQNARFVSPDVFGLYYIITPLSAVVIGGSRALLGALAGAVIVVVVPLELAIDPILNQVISGLSLTVFIILLPRGIAGLLQPRLAIAPVVTRQARPATQTAAWLVRTGEGPALRVSGIGVRYGGNQAVSDVSLSIAPGEIVGLIGPNGAGKSSFVNSISGIVRVSGGVIGVAGRDLTRTAAHTRFRAGMMARTFQNTAVVETLTVSQSLLLAGRHGLLAGSDRAAGLGQVVALCGLCGLEDVMVGTLTFLDRRLVALGMALALGPAVILLDEATAGLTAEERRRIGALVRQLAARQALGVLVIEHDIEFVAAIADRVVVMNEGRLLREGTPAEVLRDPEVISSYLGSAWNAPAAHAH